MASITRPASTVRRLPYVLPAIALGALVVVFAAACGGGSGTKTAAPAENRSGTPAEGAVSVTLYKSPT